MFEGHEATKKNGAIYQVDFSAVNFSTLDFSKVDFSGLRFI